MRYVSLAIVTALGLSACTVTSSPPPVNKPAPTKPAPAPKAPAPKVEKATFQRSASAGIAAYRRVAKNVEPVAESTCRQIHPKKPATFCNFNLQVINNPNQPPNAFQSIGKDGRPVLAFNINMLRTVKNDDEIAFILGHEAGHQIARHIEQKVSNARAGALLGALLIGASGGNAQSGADLGGFIGGRAYSKNFELQADRIGAHIAARSGYNPTRGAQSFNRTGGSNALLATHPPGQDRINTVAQTVATINEAKSRGQTAPVRW